MTELEKLRLEVAEMWMEKCHDQPGKRVDLTKKRCTDIKTNQRVIMPDPRPAREEAHLSVRTEKTLEIARKLLEGNCDSEGMLLRGGLPPETERGLKKLQKRVKEGEIIVRTTDKSKKLCINS